MIYNCDGIKGLIIQGIFIHQDDEVILLYFWILLRNKFSYEVSMII